MISAQIETLIRYGLLDHPHIINNGGHSFRDAEDRLMEGGT